MEFLPKLSEILKSDTILDWYKYDILEYPNGEERKSIRYQAIQRIDDIVTFHSFFIIAHQQSNDIITPKYQEFNERDNNMFEDIKDNEKAVTYARLSFHPFSIKQQQDQALYIANESLVINLWTTIEQYTNRCFQTLTNETTSRGNNNYKWDIITKKFEEHDVNINEISSHKDIDEIRVLNNKIKHLYIVDSRLAKFKYFEPYLGRKINTIPLRLEDYITSTYHFIIKLINLIGPTEQY
ncbi:hypothetical protein [Citrobacter portucalensis]|uniref:hypothetical protein n=1 Tax=Citrobacter portucalensis TaxID=1639133 RepID=UPI001951CA51|nr:hypothetical protein [Citrobacter portucalensis]MBM6612174.1 hypothetical protein [Citrobacter portucalensis]